MHVIALVEALDHVCCRYRIAPFVPYLADRGVTMEVVAIEHSRLARMRQFRSLRGADAVIVQRMSLPIWQLVLLRRQAQRLIYDVDDAKFQRETTHPKGPASCRRLGQYWAMVYAADAVIVGNRYLQQVTARYTEADRVHVVPTCVEPARYTPADHRRAGPAVKLAWIGQRATFPFLRAAGAHLTMAARRLPGLELRVIADYIEPMAGLEAVLCPWSSATEGAQLADADIGITWLPDDSWCRGKCGLKVLQYMAAGLPVVANPVGVHPEMVAHGQTGFLATTPDQWADAIERLAGDPDLRRRMGAAARQRIQQYYSVDTWGPRLAALIEQAVGAVPQSYRKAA